MPQVTISATLIRITRPIEAGQWLLIHPDERYDVLSHQQAMTLQGRNTRKHIPKPPSPSSLSKAVAATITIHGKTLRIEPQKVAILQYMAEHGQLSVADASTLLGATKTSILSALKNLGLVTSKPDPNHPPSFLYSITNEGRTLANGAIPNA